MDLHTSSFAQVNRHLAKISLQDTAYTPVRTSLGLPRFIKGARSWPYAHLLAPTGLLKIADRDLFTSRYRDMLDSYGEDAILVQLGGIFDMNGGKPLLLLCFEDLNRSWCHRTIFAEWWMQRTGHQVLETSPQSLQGALDPQLPLLPRSELA